jgi:hypothetical protein
MPDLRYPIGKFSFPESTTPEQRREWIREIAPRLCACAPPWLD